MSLIDIKSFYAFVKPEGYFVDVKSVLDPASMPKGVRYWSL